MLLWLPGVAFAPATMKALGKEDDRKVLYSALDLDKPEPKLSFQERIHHTGTGRQGNILRFCRYRTNLLTLGKSYFNRGAKRSLASAL